MTVTSRENQAQFYWQSSAAGLLLGIALGGLTGIGVALYRLFVFEGGVRAARRRAG